jgi:hypothetical protein
VKKRGLFGHYRQFTKEPKKEMGNGKWEMGWDGMGDLPARCAYFTDVQFPSEREAVSMSVPKCGVCPRPLN